MKFRWRLISRRFPDQLSRFSFDLRTIGFSLRLEDRSRCRDGHKAFDATPGMTVGLHGRASGRHSGLSRIESNDIQRGVIESLESEHQHEPRSERSTDYDGISAPLHDHIGSRCEASDDRPLALWQLKHDLAHRHWRKMEQDQCP
jgi:hypothetical protein